MAKAKHKLVSRLVAEEKITDKEFFTSSVFKKVLEELYEVILERKSNTYKIYCSYNTDESAPTAYTTDNITYVNSGSELVQYGKASRAEMVKRVHGLFVHELGHILYTPFEDFLGFVNCIQINHRMRREYEETREITSELKNILDNSQYRTMLLNDFKTLNNILEDGYIESRIMDDYPGSFKDFLKSVRSVHWELMPTINTVEANKNPIYYKMFQLLLEYAKYGRLKYCDEEELKLPCVKLLYRIMPYVDKFLVENNGLERICLSMDCLNEISSELLDFYKSAESSEPSDMSKLVGTSEGVKGTKSAGKSTKNGSHSSSSKGGSSTEKTRNKMKKILTKSVGEPPPKGDLDEESCSASSTSSDSDDGKDSDGISATSSSEMSEDSLKGEKGSAKSKTSSGSDDISSSDSSSSTDSTGGDEDESGELCDTTKKDVKEEPDDTTESEGDDCSDSTTESEDSDSDEESSPEDGSDSDSKDDTTGVSEDDSFSDPMSCPDDDSEDKGEDDDTTDSELGVDSLEKAIAEDRVINRLEKEREEDLSKSVKELRYGSMHEDLKANAVVKRSPVYEYNESQYKEKITELRPISKAMQKALLKKFKEMLTNSYTKHLYTGKRIDVRDAYRWDGKMFSNKRHPDTDPNIAVALLVDESGSMTGERIIAARNAAILVYDFCKSLNIPLCIYGHTESYCSRNLIMTSYSEFDSYDNKDGERLMNISAKDNNRDGMALRFVCELLSKRTEKVKLCLVISDGSPAAFRYSGKLAEDDIRSVLKEYEKNMIFSAAAIGSDKPKIKHIYGEDQFLDISNLETLPKTLIKQIVRHIS